MDCPSCGKTVAETAWICGFCDHILDPSVLGDVYDDGEEEERDRVPSVREERTSVIAWNPKPEPSDEVPDAMILGDVDVAEGDFQLVRGAAKRGDGRTATFLFYASGATSRIVHPDAIPRITGGDQTIPRTPYEDFILSEIDGLRTVRDIHRASGLAPQEVVVTLLTLLDKGAIRIDGLAPTKLRDLDDELEKTQAIQRPPSIAPIPTHDGEDLPSVTDFEEVAESSVRQPLSRADSLSDVWAEVDDEEVTNTGRPPSKKPARNERSDTKPPRVATPARETPAPLLLDPSFLVEVPGSQRSLAPALGYDDEPVVAPVGEVRRASTGKRKKAKEQQRRVLEKAVKRGPIQERRRKDEEPQQRKRARAPKAAPVAARVEEPAPLQPIDSLNMLKAQKLFDQALKDKADGNLVSARMNMKLAMTFDPTNELFAQSFDDLSKNPDAVPRSNGPTGKSRARELYDQATEAENEGDVDRAIGLLEQAIASSKQAAFLNRLGVLLAMKKREFVRAQQLVEQAIELAPDNSAYEKNLHKILSMAATADVNRQDDKDNKKGLLGLLGRRK